MKKPLIVIYTAIVLDAVGIGLVFPILPTLLRDVTHSLSLAPTLGAMAAIYAVMQFVFAPVLGALSDQLGRRPVLLISLGSAAVNYLFLAAAPALWMLFLGRAIAGLASANTAVATAYITDVSTEDQRARRFGHLNAMFGLGFIVGPVLGGLLGDVWLRLPFLAAAGLNAGNLLLALIVLPETRTGLREPIKIAALNPVRPLRWVASARELWPLVLLVFVFSATGEAYGVCWALWGQDAFGWNGLWIGLSLSAFGLCQTLTQATLPGSAVRFLGERGALLAGIAGACAALTVMAFASHGWIVLAVMPVFALGGLGVPALQSLATRQVPDDLQGQFQGVVASAASLASIVAPLGSSAVYAAVREEWPGAVWLAVVAVHMLSMPLVLGLQLTRPQAASTRERLVR